MKMKYTKLTRNNRRKRIGNLVAGILKHYGEASVENLTNYVQNRSDQPYKFICSAVRRTLQNGIRLGFVVKHKNKYSWSHQTYEVDANRVGGEGHKSLVPDERLLKEFRTSISKCKRFHSKGTQPGGPGNCKGRDLISFEPCSHLVDPGSELCWFHRNLRYYYVYQTIFAEIFWQGRLIMPQYIMERFNKIRDHADVGDSIQRFLLFLWNHFQYIQGEDDSDYVRDILVVKENTIRGYCAGIDFATTEEPCINPKNICDRHYFVITMLKCFVKSIFSIGAEPHEFYSLQSSNIEHVFEIAESSHDTDAAVSTYYTYFLPADELEFQFDEIKDKVIKFSECDSVKGYLGLVARIDMVTITRMVKFEIIFCFSDFM